MLARKYSIGQTTKLTVFFIFVLFQTLSFAGESATISWTANNEPDLAGYKVYYGYATGKYDSVVDVGKVTQYQVDNLREGETYFFVITAYDTAKNESVPSAEVVATMPVSDSVPPTIISVAVLAQNSLLVVFSEKISPASAENISNYQISAGIQVKSASLQSDGIAVNLVTDDHQSGQTYTLTVNNVADRATPSNKIAANTQKSYLYNGPPDVVKDTTAPTIANVQLVQQNQLEIVFSEKVRPELAQNKANYSITGGIGIGEIKLQADGRTVSLTTSLHQDGTTYILTVRNIADLADPANLMSQAGQWTYTYHAQDNEAPRIVDVFLTDVTHLHVLFSEVVTPTSSQQKQNYAITDGIIVNAANLQTGQKEIVLATTPHQLNHQYTLTVTGVRDQSAAQNVIEQGSTFTYLKEGQVTTPEPEPNNNGNLTVNNLNPGNYRVEKVGVGNAYYVDRDYLVVNLPAMLKDLLWIKTANDDRRNDSSDFMSFNLNQPARVYIGYDTRATSFPLWLTKNFEKTSYRIQVSEGGRFLDVWQAVLQPGKVTLGGNMVADAFNAGSMYVVLVDNQPDRQPTEALPEKFVLNQNYPNPFNPRTEISFYIDTRSLVELTVYNMVGQKMMTLVNGEMSAGVHKVSWNAKNQLGQNVPSGTYMYVLEIKEQVKNGGFVLTTAINRQVKTMTLLK